MQYLPEDLLIIVYTCQAHKKKATTIAQTWALGLTNIVYVTDFDDGSLSPVINLNISGVERLSEKSMVMWKIIYEKYRHSKKWFVKVDDDCYLSTTLLLNVLSRYDYTEPWYLGNLEYWQNLKGQKINWITGMLYVFSHKCLEGLAEGLITKEEQQDFVNYSIKEDIAVGHALAKKNIFPTHMQGVYLNLRIGQLIRINEILCVSNLSERVIYIIHLLCKVNNICINVLAVVIIKSYYTVKTLFIKTVSLFVR